MSKCGSNCGCNKCKGLVIKSDTNKVNLNDVNSKIIVKDDNKCTKVDVTAPTTNSQSESRDPTATRNGPRRWQRARAPRALAVRSSGFDSAARAQDRVDRVRH